MVKFEQEEEIIDTSSKLKASFFKEDHTSKNLEISEEFVDTWDLVETEEQDLPCFGNHSQNKIKDLAFKKQFVPPS